MEDLEITPSVRIPLDEVDVRTGPSGGPGGQHANRSHTRVDLTFDVSASPSLGTTQRERIMGKLGPVLRVTVDEHRSQSRNRALAYERLTERLAEALKVDVPRKPTKPSKAARARRLDAKRRQADRRARPHVAAGGVTARSAAPRQPPSSGEEAVSPLRQRP